MNFNDLVLEAIAGGRFDIKITKGPMRGDHYGYIPEVKIYNGRIGENTHVKFILNPINNNHITFQNYAAHFFRGEDAETLQHQALEAIYAFDTELFKKHLISQKTAETFGDIIDEL